MLSRVEPAGSATYEDPQAEKRRLARRYVPGCAVAGCKGDASWLNPDDERVYFDGHSREWLMSEDREDLGDEYQRERDAEDDDYARDCA